MRHLRRNPRTPEMKMLLPIALTLVCSLADAANAASPIGRWARTDGNARVRIARCGANICATNTWIKPGTPGEKAGDVLVMTITPVSDGEYRGSAYDPQRRMSYKITLTVNDATMTTNGCVLGGLLCKGVGWTKVGK
jgi:uncharacterized protein (DUF2147 family)